MRVAIVTESFLPSINGVTRAVTAYTSYLRRRGHNALVIAPGNGSADTEDHDGFPVVRVRGIHGLVYPDLTFAPVDPALRRRLRDFCPDVVHLASPASLGVFAGIVARSLNLPVAAHYQTDLVAYARTYVGAPLMHVTRYLERSFYNSCTATYAPTATMAAELRSRGFIDVEVSGRGVDARRFRPRRRGAGAAARRWPPGEGLRLLCVCRLAREKNLGRLVELARGWPQFRVLLVGDGPCRRELEQIAPHNVAFAGSLEGEELADVYAAAELFVYPSSTETFGQVIQEAMAAALPIVGVRAGGVADLVQHGRTGLLVEPPGAELGVAAAALDASPDLRASMGVAARRAVKPHTWGAIFDALMRDYEQLASSGAGRPRRHPPSGMPFRAAAFFDIDRTLLRGSCLLALAGPLRHAGLLTRRQLVRAGARQLMFTARGLSGAPVRRSADIMARVAGGLDPVLLRAVGRSAVATHLIPRLYPDSMRAVEAHRRTGHAIFLVSSAPEEVVGELAGHLSADGFAGTRVEVVDGRYTGRIVELCRGQAKADAVRRLARAHEIDLDRSWGYADSGDDVEMLHTVGNAVCVNPDRRLEREAVRCGWRVRRAALVESAGRVQPAVS
ncbi:MAG TPA: HAD-IB family hydrolase [Candidatus Dormibacteraeota bacterium]